MKEMIKANQMKFLPRIALKFRDDFEWRCPEPKELFYFLSQQPFVRWNKFLLQFSTLAVEKLFTSLPSDIITELVHKARTLDPTYQPPDFNRYFILSCPSETDADEFAMHVQGLEGVELAYIQSGAISPSTTTPIQNNKKIQGFMNPAPMGINARYAWKFKGGKGKSQVRLIDIEQGWISDHEALSFSTLPLSGINKTAFQDHGAGVLGVIGMKDKTKHRTGITPHIIMHVISPWRADGSPNDADAILSALYYLQPGDVLLIESQAFHSTHNNTIWPIEIQEAAFQAIRLASASGIIVIEAAGNGDQYSGIGNDLDLFQQNEKNILDTQSPFFKDSGAILVSAATPSVPHHRFHFSNYGSRINSYAWGSGIETTGAYPGSSGSFINRYTEYFSGTSGAAAIITGAALAIQSISEANYHIRLDPKQMRTVLSSEIYGTSSSNGHMQDKIGVMPNLKKIINHYLHISPE